MDNWQKYLPTIFVSLVLSILLAKLISYFLSLKKPAHRTTRKRNPDPIPKQPELRAPTWADESDSVVAEMGSVADLTEYGTGGISGDDEDDWEGVESTELDDTFTAAASFVAAAVADEVNVPPDVQLQLYALYKIATEGPCSLPQPSVLKMRARAKWQAWHKLGAMPPEEAMNKYIDIVTGLYPSWASDSNMKGKEGTDREPSSAGKGPMGAVFSTFIHEEESGNELEMDAVHAFAREGEVNTLRKCLGSSVPVNLKDSDGQTSLHWAVDRGHLNVVELLVSRNADVNAKDDQGHTPLHYAVLCERERIAEYLVKHNADPDVKDKDGNSPRDLCKLNWPCLQNRQSRTDGCSIESSNRPM